MKIIKPQRLSLLTRTYEYEGKFYLAANIMAFISFDQPRRLLSEQSMWKFAATALGKDTILDMGMPKQRGEFVVFGKCHAPAGRTVTAAMVRVKVGALEKSLAVLGERYWESSGFGKQASEPASFSAIDMNYSNAFGGDGFANNPTGKGMPPADNAVPHFLPNIETPDAPVVFIDDRPQPAGLSPLDFTWPQRMSKAGTYDDAWLKTRFPGYAKDMDWSIFNTTQTDQWLPDFFSGDESFEVSGMHPEKPVVRGQLPTCAVRCFVTAVGDTSHTLREVPTRAETLVLFPGSERAIVMFRGVTEISTDDGADIAHILVGAEDMVVRKPLAHYQSVLHTRLDKKNGAIHSLIDEPLLPDMPVSTSKGDALDVDEMDALVRPKMLLRKNLLVNAQKTLDDGKQALTKVRADLIATHMSAGMPPPDLTEIDKALATTIAPDPEPPRLEELPELKAKLEKLLEDAKADAMVKKAEAEALLRKTCVEQKLDFDKIMLDAKTQGSGPPKPMLEKVMSQLRSTAEDLKTQGIVSPELDDQLADKGLPIKLAEGDVALMKAYRDFAHVYPAVGAYSDEDNAKARADVLQGVARGDQFAGRDFSGADFSGLKLASANFAGALLEGVNFSGADLTGADFSTAVLARAIFTEATLTKANFAGANLGFAKLAGVDASAANFASAKLAGADLTRINLRGAELSKCDLMGAKLAGADFSGVNAPEVKFIQVDLMPAPDAKPDMEGLPELPMAGIKFVNAKLNKAMFLNCRMDNADFSNACLDGVVFLTAQGSRVNFSGASLVGFCAVKDCKLQHANFTGSNLQKANFRGSDLHLSVFTKATLTDADLSECLLTSVNAKAATAINLQLVKAKLAGSDFSGANLQQVNLQKADMKGTLFFGTNLYMADFLRASHDDSTVFERANMKKTLLKKAKS
ncbi:MAG: DUF2169 domain-containing protein [Polaromonas sp.]